MQSVIDILIDIAKPFDNGNGLKEKSILTHLQNYEAKYIKDIGIVVPAKKTKRITVTSHIDLIKKFNKSFARQQSIVYDNKIISGALDNSLTNAILILAIKELRAQDMASDIEFVFTEGEETGLNGIKEYLKDDNKDSFFINLDVTNDNWNYYASVEYDNPNFHICKQIESRLNIGFTTERISDDLCAVISSGGYGFSYCIPTKNEIHSLDNYTLVEKIEHYYNGLIFMLTELDVAHREHNIKNIKIEKALRFETEKDFLKKMKKRQEKIKKRIRKNMELKKSVLGSVKDFKEFVEDETVAERAISVLQEYDIHNKELYEFIKTESTYRNWITKEDFLLVSSKKEIYQVIDLLTGAQLLEEDEIYNRWRFVRKVPKNF